MAQKANKKKKSGSRELAEALLTALIIALFLRTFVVEAFKIPSGSMIPTLAVGDHLFVSKFSYGIRLPFSTKWLVRFGEPERGEVVVFIAPENFVPPSRGSVDYIKRVVGVPGDHVRVVGDDVYVNGEKVRTAPVKVQGENPKNREQLDLVPPLDFPEGQNFTRVPSYPRWQTYQVFLERLGEHTHLKQESKLASQGVQEWKVPKDHLFVMGDNRDESSDSRFNGFVPMKNLKGRALFIWLSLVHDYNPETRQWYIKYPLSQFWKNIRWGRFGKGIP